MENIKGYLGKSETPGKPQDTYIYYTDGRDVFRAPINNVVDVRTGYLIGRWECSLTQFNHFRESVYNFLTI